MITLDTITLISILCISALIGMAIAFTTLAIAKKLKTLYPRERSRIVKILKKRV